jgi:DNA-binding MarR family transcriptional regulator
LLARISVPSSPLLRWIRSLEAEGLGARKMHRDGADPMVTLTSKGSAALDTYFDAGASQLGSASDELASGRELRSVRRD